VRAGWARHAWGVDKHTLDWRHFTSGTSSPEWLFSGAGMAAAAKRSMFTLSMLPLWRTLFGIAQSTPNAICIERNLHRTQFASNAACTERSHDGYSSNLSYTNLSCAEISGRTRRPAFPILSPGRPIPGEPGTKPRAV
jgi:hypothetical protein